MQFNYQINRLIADDNKSIHFQLKGYERSNKDQLNQKITSIINELLQDLNKSYLSKKIDYIEIKNQGDQVYLEFNLVQDKKRYTYKEMSGFSKEKAAQIIDLIKEHKIFSQPISVQTIEKSPPPLLKMDEGAKERFFAKIIRIIRQIIIYHRLIQPLAKSVIQRELKNNLDTMTEIKGVYSDKHKIFAEIKEKILEKNPSINQFFSNEKINEIVDDLLIEEINKNLQSIYKLQLNAREFKELNIVSLIKQAALNSDSDSIIEKLNKINPLDIPIQQLATISLNPENKLILTDLWKNLLKKVFEGGKFKELKETKDFAGMIIQAQFAYQYSNILNLMPEEIRKELKPLIDEFEKKQSLSIIEHRLLQSTKIAMNNSNFDDLLFATRQKAYTENVRLQIEYFIEDHVTCSIDGTNLANLLALNSLASLQQIEKLKKDILENLSGQKEYFTPEKIEFFIYQELEKIAVFNYHFTSTQINNLRQARQPILNSTELKSADLHSINTFVEKPIDFILFDRESVASLKEAEFTSVFSKSQLDLLLSFNQVLNQIDLKEGKKQEITFEEKQMSSHLLEEYEKDPTLKEKLKLFFLDDNRSFELTLAQLPSFLRPLLRKILGKNQVFRDSDLKLPFGINKKNMEFLLNYSNCLKKYEKEKIILERLNKKVKELIDKKDDPNFSFAQNRLTLKQLGILGAYSRMNDLANRLEKINRGSEKQDLKNFISSVHEAKANFSRLEGLIRESADKHYQDGSILAYVGKKKVRWAGRSLPIEEQLTAFLANDFTHGAKLYHNKKGEIQISHVVGELNQENFSLYQLCVSETWELDIIPLLSSNMQEALLEIMGEGWQEKVNSEYRQIEKNLHEIVKGKLGKVGNFKDRRFKAGLADFSFLFKLAAQDEFLSHRREYPKDFDKLHDKFFEGASKDEEQICSEFASKSTLVSMMELNKILSRQILLKKPHLSGQAIIQRVQEEKIEISNSTRKYLEGLRFSKSEFKRVRLVKSTHREDKVQKVARRKKAYGEATEIKLAEKEVVKLLKQLGYNTADRELIIRLGNKEIFDLPYKKTERLKAIHPGRMVKLLTDKKCAVRKEPPPILRQFIDLDK